MTPQLQQSYSADMSWKGVGSALVGVGVAALVIFNARKLTRCLAVAALAGEDAAVATFKHIRKASSEFAEDFQDDIAAIREQRRSAAENTPESLLAAVRDVREEMEQASFMPGTRVN